MPLPQRFTDYQLITRAANEEYIMPLLDMQWCDDVRLPARERVLLAIALWHGCEWSPSYDDLGRVLGRRDATISTHVIRLINTNFVARIGASIFLTQKGLARICELYNLHEETTRDNND